MAQGKQRGPEATEAPVNCIKCGRPVTGNVDPDKVIVCGLCVLSYAADVDRHPEKYLDASLKPDPKKKFSLPAKREPRERVCPCGNTFVRDSRRQKYCQMCHRLANLSPGDPKPVRGGGKSSRSDEVVEPFEG